jgi:hypothetical protein
VGRLRGRPSLSSAAAAPLIHGPRPPDSGKCGETKPLSQSDSQQLSPRDKDVLGSAACLIPGRPAWDPGAAASWLPLGRSSPLTGPPSVALETQDGEDGLGTGWGGWLKDPEGEMAATEQARAGNEGPSCPLLAGVREKLPGMEGASSPLHPFVWTPSSQALTHLPLGHSHPCLSSLFLSTL